MRQVTEAIKNNQSQELEQLLDDNADLLETPIIIFGGTTILMQAASEGGAGILQTVLQYEPDLEKVDKQGRTALHYACRAGNLQTLRMLIQQDVNIEARTQGGVTPLMAGIQSGAIHIVNELVTAGCNPMSEDVLG